MTVAAAGSPVDRLVAALGNQLDFSNAQRSFSPFYSTIGLGFSAGGGIAQLLLHYNRRTLAVGAPFLKLPGIVAHHERTALFVRQGFEEGHAAFAFRGRNSFLVDVCGLGNFVFGLDGAEASAPDGPAAAAGAALPFIDLRCTAHASGAYIYDGYLPTADARDPDKLAPVSLGFRMISEDCSVSRTENDRFTFNPGPSDRLVLCFSISILEADHDSIVEQLLYGPTSFDDAVASTRRWYNQAIGKVDVGGAGSGQAGLAARAAYTIVSNTAAAPGYLGGRIATYPNRGECPAHFTWESCFQNLALEQMEPRLAPDSLLLLTENLRPDGKMPQFLCSTWTPPYASHPPLVGWAALRLVRQRNNLDLARKFLPALERNTRWWLTQRMTSRGLVATADPLELAMEGTPRLERGPILAPDINSYLLMQMRAAAEMARLLAQPEQADALDARADDFAGRIMFLYDPGENVFKDTLITGEKLPLKTPACFMPLLAGAPVPESAARQMIGTVLLDPKRFFGKIPFPSVAYDQGGYESGTPGRGALSLPLAWLMLEILRKYGFNKEAAQAAASLRDILISDGECREAYDSQTGQGVGCVQHAAAAAVALLLLKW